MDNKNSLGINVAQFSTTTDDGIPIKKLYVKNIPDNMNKNELTSIFSKYGEVKCNCPKGKKSKRFAFVTFTDENIALKVRIFGHKKQLVCGGNILKVSPASSNKQPDYHAYKKYQHSMPKIKSKNKPVHDILDDDCLIKIFQYLPIPDRLRIERVSKRWRAVNLQSWTNMKSFILDVDSFDEDDYVKWELLNDRAIGKILTLCGRFLHTLKIDSFMFHCTSAVIPTITKHCHNLNYLSLRLPKYQEEDLALLFLSTQKLSKLHLINVDPYFTGDSLENLPIDSMEDIILISDCNYHEFTPRYMSSLSENSVMAIGKMNKLRSFELDGFKLEYNILKYIANNKAISHLSFAQCSIDELNLIANLHGLTYLNLSHVHEVNDEFLNNLTTKCSHIKYLDISDCTAVTNTGINAIAKLCKLQTLRINNLSDVTDDAISILRTIKVLHCASCLRIGNNGVIELIENSASLEELDISYSDVTPELLDTVYNIIIDQNNRVPLKIIVCDILKMHWDELKLTTSSLVIALCEDEDEDLGGLTCWDTTSSDDFDYFYSGDDRDYDYDDWENDYNFDSDYSDSYSDL